MDNLPILYLPTRRDKRAKDSFDCLEFRSEMAPKLPWGHKFLSRLRREASNDHGGTVILRETFIPYFSHFTWYHAELPLTAVPV